MAQLRQLASNQPLANAVARVRHIQVRRFERTYSDFLDDAQHRDATTFFLRELYGDHDFSARDQQFGRIAGAIERLFPSSVMAIAVQLAHIHAVTEELDWTMARHWLSTLSQVDTQLFSDAQRYVFCWRLTGAPDMRQLQLHGVLELGQRLDDVVHTRGLRTALRMMRGPAQAAGLAELQSVLESGFDAFKGMGAATRFLAAVGDRESSWITALFARDERSATRSLEAMLVDAA